MTYRDTTGQLAAYRKQIDTLRGKMRELQASVEPEEVADYALTGRDGTVKLSELFGDNDTLIVIHNMGKTCPACTMWADGYNGLLPHLRSRAAFVLTSPDDPETQAAFAASRGWNFRMLSHQGTDFATAMGYRGEQGGWLPGISVFKRDGDHIVRVSDQRFAPGDDFCSVWHFLDMMPEGWNGWRPRFSYS
jgi:predicted dithiol-disulfide oxidoreductase (DUF899 family)